MGLLHCKPEKASNATLLLSSLDCSLAAPLKVLPHLNPNRHVLSIPPGHPQREADSVGEKDRVHRGQSKQNSPSVFPILNAKQLLHISVCECRWQKERPWPREDHGWDFMFSLNLCTHPSTTQSFWTERSGLHLPFFRGDHHKDHFYILWLTFVVLSSWQNFEHKMSPSLGCGWLHCYFSEQSGNHQVLISKWYSEMDLL